ncbi:MAG: hypothetical protein US42_C0018G0037 [Candidatus Magasanikbacteria bacterium GW2011_GWC2_37_14]|uniref:Uncharacterized protein n=1 Tax=Candidatus Magasanikbacteria bacterium GW2011_GWC2_37_14 TaxID=1619046 RepID=A0A0G0G774_9BACT|nr:MAG: hypothetical protein US42_C0018G0037 [Candidatus Magasanikbacteria bacterium GW2011_GWC2_37_14]
MPVKKKSTSKKSNEKKSTNKKSTEHKQIKKDIKAAIEKIPGLIYEKVEFTESNLSQIPQQKLENSTPVDYETIKRKRLYVWLAVIGITILIFGMWLWNTRTFLQIAKNDSSEFVNTIKKDWQKINQEKDSELQKLIPEKVSDENLDQILKNSLIKTFNNLATSTSSTVSTTISL